MPNENEREEKFRKIFENNFRLNPAKVTEELFIINTFSRKYWKILYNFRGKEFVKSSFLENIVGKFSGNIEVSSRKCNFKKKNWENFEESKKTFLKFQRNFEAIIFKKNNNIF